MIFCSVSLSKITFEVHEVFCDDKEEERKKMKSKCIRKDEEEEF